MPVWYSTLISPRLARAAANRNYACCCAAIRGRMELEEVERTGKLLRRRFDRNIRVTAERTNAEY